MDDDFNTPQSLVALVKLIADYNADQTVVVSKEVQGDLLYFFEEINGMFHFISTDMNKKVIVRATKDNQKYQYLIFIQQNTFEAPLRRAEQRTR